MPGPAHPPSAHTPAPSPGKYNKGAQPEGARHTWDPKFQPRYLSARVLAAAQKYERLAKSQGLTPAVLAMAWANQCFFNQSIIIGANNMDQLNECLSVVDVTLNEVWGAWPRAFGGALGGRVAWTSFWRTRCTAAGMVPAPCNGARIGGTPRGRSSTCEQRDNCPFLDQKK